MPEVQRLEGVAAARWFHGADVEEELSVRGEEGSNEFADHTDSGTRGAPSREAHHRGWSGALHARS